MWMIHCIKPEIHWQKIPGLFQLWNGLDFVYVLRHGLSVWIFKNKLGESGFFSILLLRFSLIRWIIFNFSWMKGTIYGRPVNLNQIELAEILICHNHLIPLYCMLIRGFLKQHLPLENNLAVFTDSGNFQRDWFSFQHRWWRNFAGHSFTCKRFQNTVVGVRNAGRLGFLSSVSRDSLELLSTVWQKDIIPRMQNALRVESNFPILEGQNSCPGMNLPFTKASSWSPFIHIWMVNTWNSYWADGIMISTPTGSTGLFPSCGGPVIVPPIGSFSNPHLSPTQPETWISCGVW